MNRDGFLQTISDRTREWDVIIVGGGATGLGAAVEAAARGHSTLLLEKADFAGATSSRSTKLIHGGVRYLRQGNIRLVRESLRERGRLLRNAPGLVHPIAFGLPVSSLWELAWYGAGLKLYDALAGAEGLSTSRVLGANAMRNRLPGLAPDRVRGGVLYYDAQFDDARLAVALAQTTARLGGIPLNYAPVVELRKRSGRVSGVVARDAESGREFECRAKSVVNAGGIFADSVRRMDDPAAASLLALSQGAHLVLDRSFFPGETAMIVPRTDDGRVLFLIPWQDRLLVGTTDVPVVAPTPEPVPQEAEIDYLLEHLGRYLVRRPSRGDILSAWAGLRPLVRSGGGPTAAMPRDHYLSISQSGLVTIAGGKWTTYRRMGEDAVDAAEKAGGLEARAGRTGELRVLEAEPEAEPDSGMRLHPRLMLSPADVRRAVRQEMARTLEDTLARRNRALFLDSRAASEAAPAVAAIMAGELGRDESWTRGQLAVFQALATGYRPS